MRWISGGGLVGILLVVLILGIVGAKSLGSSNVPNPTVTTETSMPPGSNGSVPIRSLALSTECSSDVQAVQTAVSTFNTLNFSSTIARETRIQLGYPMSYAEGEQATRLAGAGMISSWPSSDEFAISLSTSVPGAVALYIPANAHEPVAVGGNAAVSCQRLA
jgi:hypothetical protein